MSVSAQYCVATRRHHVLVGSWTQEMWLKFPTEQAIMFTDEQLKAGANVLKDMTEEQLAQYDWSQMDDDALTQLPIQLKDKIADLPEVCRVVLRLPLIQL